MGEAEEGDVDHHPLPDEERELGTQIERDHPQGRFEALAELFQNLSPPVERNCRVIPNSSRLFGSATARSLQRKHYLQVTDEHFQARQRRKPGCILGCIFPMQRHATRYKETRNPGNAGVCTGMHSPLHPPKWAIQDSNL